MAEQIMVRLRCGMVDGATGVGVRRLLPLYVRNTQVGGWVGGQNIMGLGLVFYKSVYQGGMSVPVSG